MSSSFTSLRPFLSRVGGLVLPRQRPPLPPQLPPLLKCLFANVGPFRTMNIPRGFPHHPSAYSLRGSIYLHHLEMAAAVAAASNLRTEVSPAYNEVRRPRCPKKARERGLESRWRFDCLCYAQRHACIGLSVWLSSLSDDFQTFKPVSRGGLISKKIRSHYQSDWTASAARAERGIIMAVAFVISQGAVR